MILAPSWMVTRTGRVVEKVTPANLRVWGSDVGTYRKGKGRVSHRKGRGLSSCAKTVKCAPIREVFGRSSERPYLCYKLSYRNKKFHTCAKFVISRTADLMEVESVLESVVRFLEISCMPLSFSAGFKSSEESHPEGG